MRYFALRMVSLPPFFRFAFRLAGAVAIFAASMVIRAEDFQGSTHQVPFDEELHYNAKTPDDAVARLQKTLESGAIKLKWDDKFGYLPGLLEALGISKSSQMLVFSKTSLQRTFISPSNPRSLYFNDDVYIGYIPGAPHLEVSAVDPKLGGIFYTLEQEKVRRPKFARDADCLRCHAGPRSMGVPGHILRSIGTDETGELDTQTEVQEINHCTPLADRWGGWYVTGTHGSQTHRGNLIGAEAFARQAREPNYLGNLSDLSRFFDPSNYLAPTSDICAEMVLEHQAHMHNYITRLNDETQLMMESYGHIRYLRHQEDAFLRYLLFTEEAPLSEPVVGDSDFAREFAARGPRDSKGRSLRDFDMRTRMFKYPCSFLIYSDAFDQLPGVMHDLLLQRLYDILTGKDADPQFARLAAEDRRAILEILRETKPNLPELLAPPMGCERAACRARPLLSRLALAERLVQSRHFRLKAAPQR